MRIFVFLFVFLLNGCSWNTFYFPVVRDDAPFLKLSDTQKKEITYSISVFGENYLIAGQSENKLRKIWKENLVNLHLFKRVRYAFPSEKSKYHFHFTYVYGGLSAQETETVLSISVGSLSILPVGTHRTFDVVMTAYLDGKEVYSIVASTKQKQVVWLPLLICLPVTITSNFNYDSRYQDYLMKMIVDNKLYDLDNYSNHI